MGLISETYDLIIVGAGSSGCVLARRLAERTSLSILLLEAGEEPSDPRIADPAAWPFLQGSEIDWAFRTTPQPGLGDRVEDCPRGKVIGGSSAIHAMGHMRGHPCDFDAWVEAGATGWDYQSILPYFVRSESSPFAGTSGYGRDGPIHLQQPPNPHPLSLAHIEAGAERGLMRLRDHNGGTMAGATLNTMTIMAGKRQSVADAYLTSEIRSLSNLTIRTGGLVNRVLLDEQQRATGVELAQATDREVLNGRAGVVLAAGSIGSPCILMRSGLGPGDMLSALDIPVRHALPGLGQNLQDHLLCGGNVYHARRDVPMTNTQHSEAMIYIPASGADPNAAPDLVVGVASIPLISQGLVDLRTPPEIGHGYTLMFGITHPRSRGHLSLKSADPIAPPIIDPQYLTHTGDKFLFVEALHWARKLGSSRAYDDWRAEEVFPRHEDLVDDKAQATFISRAALTHHHPVGTARMGSDAGAPVTPDLTVRGTTGLYIADGSVFPSLTTGPVNATIIAVAERAADMLIKKIGPKL